MIFIHFSSLLLALNFLSRSSAQLDFLSCDEGGSEVLNCSSKTAVSCTTDGKPCKEYFSNRKRDDDCPTSDASNWIDVDIKYEYCNCNTNTGESIVTFQDKSFGLYRSQVVMNGPGGYTFKNELAPTACEMFITKKAINTCNAFAKAEISYNGYNKNFGIENSVCFSSDKAKWDYPVVEPPYDPNICSANVYCFSEDGSQCGDIAKGKTCGITPVDIVWKYCNKGTTAFNLAQDTNQSFIRFNNISEDSIDLSPIPTGECREVRQTKQINTCITNEADIRITGELNDGSATCDAFGSIYIETKTEPPTKSPTAAPTVTQPTAPNTDCSNKVFCNLKDGGKVCAGNITGGSKCGYVPVTYRYKYCNKNSNVNFLPNKSSESSFLKIDGVHQFLDLKSVPPGGCREFKFDDYIDSCRDSDKPVEVDAAIEGSFKGTKAWCRAENHISIGVKKEAPTPAPKPPTDGDLCKVQTFCKIDENDKPCLGNISRSPSSPCGNVDVTIFWKFCNKHTVKRYLLDKSDDKTYMKIRGVLLPDMNKSPLNRGRCRSVETKETINTCLNVNKIEMRVEGTFEDTVISCTSEKIINVLTKDAPVS